MCLDNENIIGSSDSFTKMMEAQMEEMKKRNEEQAKKREAMEARIEKVVQVLNGLNYSDAEAVLDGTKRYLAINIIVKL